MQTQRYEKQNFWYRSSKHRYILYKSIHFKMHIDLHAFLLSMFNFFFIYIMGGVFAVDTFLTHVIKHELTPHEMYTGTKTQPKAIRKNTA